MGDYSWDHKIVKPLKRELEGDRFKLELLGLLQMDDEVERERLIAQMAPKYSMSADRIERAMGKMRTRTAIPVSNSRSLSNLFDDGVEAISWLIPELLPKGETVLLVGAPKDGKTLLTLDAAFCLATNDVNFLSHTRSRRHRI